MKKAQIGEHTFEIDQQKEEYLLNGQSFKFDVAESGNGDLHFLVNNKSYQTKVISIDKEEKTVQVKVNNTPYTVSVKDNLDLLLAKLGMESVGQAGAKDVKAPMPGLIIDVLVSEGQEVKKGDHLLILEAMKMENVIKCPADGVVSGLHATKGDSVEKGKILLSL
ncbi:MAG: biotin/lipoyl-containing protein [Reichenbachiella sp.]|uniref:biotin/lipoyl-containing protein n=1 Tax=Reichenbachiella sp. TaxID=2184521 RepID=UPI002966439C|nr:biotin/lipoyl-containing protein [Reichenbachiella sp.]MDW3211861.1 biotin/lipoyl-containing protein [Reichenbachiella sp.]